jgi:hypothetical protein
MIDLLEKDNIIIHWSAKKDDNLIKGVTVKKCSFALQTLSLKYVRTVLKNSCHINIEIKSFNSNYLVTLQLSCENLFELLPDLVNYEIYISDEEFEFDWLGLKSQKINSQTQQPLDLTFRLITDRKGQLEVSKISIILLFKNNEKPVVLNNFPAPIFIDLK